MNNDIKSPLFSNTNIIRGNLKELKLYDDKDLELGEIKNIFENPEQAAPAGENLFGTENAPKHNGFDAAF